MTQLYAKDWDKLTEVDLVVKGSSEFSMELIDHWIQNNFTIDNEFPSINIERNTHQYLVDIYFRLKIFKQLITFER